MRILAAVCLALSVATPAAAASIAVVLNEFSGADARVQATFDDAAAGAGNIQITLEVLTPPSIGDLRGLFLNVSDDSILAGLVVTGAHVSDYEVGDVWQVGGGNNLNGGPASPCPCDVGIEFGSPGIGADDLQTVVLVLSHPTESLDLSLLAGQEIGARLTSVGTLGSRRREDSSKLAALMPVLVPEPSTAPLVAAGLAWLAARRGRSQRPGA